MISSIIATSAAPAPAHADNVSDKKAQAAALAAKINADSRQVEVLAEQFNGAQLHLTQVQQQLADAAQRLQTTQATTEQNRVALAKEAVQAYMHGGVATSRTMKSFNGSVDFAVQQGYFQLATGNQVDALDQLRQSEKALRQQQTALQASQRDSQAALASVSSRQQAVQAAAAASQASARPGAGRSGPAGRRAASTAGGKAANPGAGIAPVRPGEAFGHRCGHARRPSDRRGTHDRSHVRRAPRAPQGAGADVGYVDRADTPTAPPTTKAKAPAPPPPPPAPAPSSGAAAALAYARAQLGKPYQWGAAGPTAFDCSGLTMRAWAAGGVSLPHFAAGQYAATAHVAIADLQPGDLVFFGSDLHHVGIYVGGGQMINAPTTGSVVRYDGIFWPDLQPYGGRP